MFAPSLQFAVRGLLLVCSVLTRRSGRSGGFWRARQVYRAPKGVDFGDAGALRPPQLSGSCQLAICHHGLEWLQRMVGWSETRLEWVRQRRVVCAYPASCPGPSQLRLLHFPVLQGSTVDASPAFANAFDPDFEWRAC